MHHTGQTVDLCHRIRQHVYKHGVLYKHFHSSAECADGKFMIFIVSKVPNVNDRLAKELELIYSLNTRDPHGLNSTGKSGCDMGNHNGLIMYSSYKQEDYHKLKFSCGTCERKFLTEETLKVHEKLHCKICGTAFWTNDKLKYHLVKHK